jgi:MFS transporter, DHA1 family, multidrug resistance protein
VASPALAPSPLKRPEFRNLLAISITVALGFGMIVPVLPLYARNFGVGLAAVGLVQLVFGLTRFSFGIVGGLTVDRFGERAATIAGLLIVSASSFAIGFADSFPQLVVARGFGGAGSALFVGGLMNRIIRIIEPAAMGRATGISRSTFLVGIGAGPVLGGLVAQAFGAEMVFFLYGGGLVVAAVIAWVVMAGPAADREVIKRSPVEALRAARPLFSDSRYMVALAATFVGWWTISGPAQTIGAVFAREQLALTQSQIGLAISLLAVGEIAALIIAGRLADRFGRRAVLIPSLAVLAAGTVLIGQITAGTPWHYYAVMVVVGIGIAASAAAAGGLHADSLPRGGSGTAVGVNQMSGDLGFLLSPVAIGGLAEGADSFPLAYAAAAVPAALVCLYSFRLPGGVTRREEEEEVPIEPQEPVG